MKDARGPLVVRQAHRERRLEPSALRQAPTRGGQAGRTVKSFSTLLDPETDREPSGERRAGVTFYRRPTKLTQAFNRFVSWLASLGLTPSAITLQARALAFPLQMRECVRAVA